MLRIQRFLTVATLCVAAPLLGGCGPSTSGAETPAPPPSFESPHQAHAWWIRDVGLDRTEVGKRWLEAGAEAARSPVSTPLPFAEEGWFGADEALALGYHLRIDRGQKVEVTLAGEEGEPIPFFVDAYPADVAGQVRTLGERRPHPSPTWSSGPGILATEFEPPDSGEYVLRLQPEILRGGRYRITLRSRPILDFPVYGLGTSAILSFFGAERDGGRRSHHGVDIFAPRGTPVVAAVAGRVSRVRETNLGGKVVWLRDSVRNASLYYAHLDVQLVSNGDQVQPGDTLGLVGNTGNARTTPPHLHFGVYKRGEGPINPFPFLRQLPGTPSELAVDPGTIGVRAASEREGLRVRDAPSLRASVVEELDPSSSFRVLAGSGDWYRILMADGRQGFVLGRLARPVSEQGYRALAEDAAQEGG
jgi:murein DD-endopeptidase MepM/ murein hydrolase activator NlpD